MARPRLDRTADEADALARELRGVPASRRRHRGGQPPPLPRAALPRSSSRTPRAARTSWTPSSCVDLDPLRRLFRRPRHGEGVPQRGQRRGVPEAPVRSRLRRPVRTRCWPPASWACASSGLERLLLKYLDVQPCGRSRRRTGPAGRSPCAEHYAAEDVRHLIVLRERLLTDLARSAARLGSRSAGAGQRLPVPERPPDEDGYRRYRRRLALRRAAWACCGSSFSSGRRGRGPSTGRPSRS